MSRRAQPHISAQQHKAAIAFCSLLVACASPAASTTVAESRNAIEASQRDKVFALAGALSDERTALARFKELSARATGALLTPFVSDAGAALRAADGTAVRGTCGVTFISPSYAITAAHCVDGQLNDLDDLQVEMYRPTSILQQSRLVAATLSGTFPNFTHAALAANDGYFTDRYACVLRARCSDAYGGRLACDADASPRADVALLFCRDRPADKYGFLELADRDDAAAEPFFSWQHEVYSEPAGEGRDFLEHYAMLGPDKRENFHYFGRDSAGVERNQLLPLISVALSPDAPHQKISIDEDQVMTDLLGCHGSSGSSVLQQGDDGHFRLLGPLVLGNHELEEYLCNHIPALDAFSREPGCLGLSYGGLGITRRLYEQARASLARDCDPLASGSSNLGSEAACYREHWAESAGGLDANARFGEERTVANSYLRTRSLRVAPAERIELTGIGLLSQERYRFALSVRSNPPCADAACGRVALRVGEHELASFSVSGSPATLTDSVWSPVSGTATLVVEAGAVSALELDEVTLRGEARVQRFDSAAERAEASLIDLTEASPTPLPARFVGDGEQGFRARLLENERLVLSQQALGMQALWSVRFTIAGAAKLRCGLLNSSGVELIATDCSSGPAQLDARERAREAAALFIETAAVAQPVELDDVQIVSDRMPDADADGVPDAVDSCPNGLVTQGSTLGVVAPQPLLISSCTPEPREVTLIPPQVSGACETPHVEATLIQVNGRKLDGGGIRTASDYRVLLPPGVHQIAWSVNDRAGNAFATLQSEVELRVAQTPNCAEPDQIILQSGTNGAALLASNAACVLGGPGDDLAIGSGGHDFISGGAGADYLAGNGTLDVFVAGRGNDVLTAAAGSSISVFAGDGDDSVFAPFAAQASLFGGRGNDVLIAGNGDDLATPGPGADQVVLGAGDDSLRIYDVCELRRGAHWDGGAGSDTVIAPVPLQQLLAAGIEIENFENFVQDDSLTYVSECFSEP